MDPELAAHRPAIPDIHRRRAQSRDAGPPSAGLPRVRPVELPPGLLRRFAAHAGWQSRTARLGDSGLRPGELALEPWV